MNEEMSLKQHMRLVIEAINKQMDVMDVRVYPGTIIQALVVLHH